MDRMLRLLIVGSYPIDIAIGTDVVSASPAVGGLAPTPPLQRHAPRFVVP